MSYKLTTHFRCVECGGKLPRRQVKFCGLTCKTKNRNARRREKYAASK